MKNKKKWWFLTLAVFLLIIVLVGCLFIFKEDEEEKTNEKEETYTMYVKINPLVKLVFKEQYTLCKDENNADIVCGGIDTEVIGYELLNDDAKDIYDDLNFKGKTIEEVLLILCDTARDNKVGFKSLEITSDSNDLDSDKLFKYLQDNSRYEDEVEIYVNFEEYIDEDKILENEEKTEEQTYTIKFDSDGGNEIENQKINANDKIKEPTKPTKDGYTFVEWQLDGKKYDFNAPVTKDMTLKAVWEKQKTDDYPKPSTNNNTGKEEKPQENKPKITSTISKINLNENIMIEIYYPTTACGWDFFPTNLEKIFPEHVQSKHLYIDDGSYGLARSAYEAKEDQIEYDTTKENNAVNELKVIANKKIPGIANFRYSFNSHRFSYDYEVIGIVDRDTFKELNDALDKNSNQIYNIFKDAYVVSGPCGTGPDSPTLLTEEICEKYNLTCARW